MSDEKIEEIPLPTHLTRYEKRALRTLLGQQLARGQPISVMHVDALADYVSARSRIRALTRSWRAAVRERNSFASDEQHAMRLCRQLDATVKLSRRLAAELGIDP